MITLVKLGGSLITDKRVENSYRQDVTARVASEIARFRQSSPDAKIIIGHGSGSFGHVTASRYGTKSGVYTPSEWLGFTKVAASAAALNTLVVDTLQEAGIPAMRFQPSASAVSEDGQITSMALEGLQFALSHGVVPVVYGDVCVDRALGGTITSTETIFTYLTRNLPVSRIFLLGEVDGVYDLSGVTIPLITPANFQEVEAALGGSSGVDVTGGMETKVSDMLALVQSKTGLQIRIFNGLTPGLLHGALRESDFPGTLIRMA